MDTHLQIAKDREFLNSLSSLCDTLKTQHMFGSDGPMISQADTLFANLRWYLVSNFRQLVTQLYVEHGIVQTLIDQPVDDAFRAGFEIKTAQLDADDVEELLIYEQRNRVIESLQQAIKWARLYGGASVLIITDQDPATPLNLKKIGPDTPLEFRPTDMWELYFNAQNTAGDLGVGEALGANMGDHYNYYGKTIHTSRVYRILGKEPPAYVKPRLRGWAMSELERLVRSLNQYLKNQDVIFELLDEAKVDVYRIKGFNTGLMNKDGTTQMAKRIQGANMLKSFNSALIMDANDEYAQKQINFTGLNDMLLQIRQGIAADLKMPMTKLFGISAAGFNSGEDDIENYNSMLEGEIRAKNRFTVVDLLQICCQKVFGTTVDDLMITFNPLRILNAKEEEEVKDSQFTRTMTAYTSGLVSAQEAKESFNKDSLLPVEVDETADAEMPLPDPRDEMEGPKPAKGAAGKKTPAQE